MQEICLSQYASNGHPFEIAFIYADSGNFVVKGMSDIVSDFLQREYKHYFANRTFWANGVHRSYWSGCTGVYIKRQQAKKRRIWCVQLGNHWKFKQSLTYRRLPKKWLPEWTEIIEKVAKDVASQEYEAQKQLGNMRQTGASSHKLTQKETYYWTYQ